MKFIDIDHVVITTSDVTACLHFYVGVLGMEMERENGRYAVRFGDHKFNIHKRSSDIQPVAAHPTIGSLDLCLVVDEPIVEAQREIELRGYPVELGPVQKQGARGPMQSIYLHDPDGNLVEISSYA